MIQSTSEATESGTVRQSVGKVVHDVVTLAELQGRLFQSDSREFAVRIARPLAVFLGGMVFGAATVPIALVAIADGLLYTADAAGTVYCFDADTGNLYWTHAGAAGWSSPLVAAGKV